MSDGTWAGPAPADAIVLLVEDDERIASFMRRGLRAHGFTVEWVTTGQDAIDRVSAGGVAVQVLDLGLPDMDGLDVMRVLSRGASAVPVIIVTARSDPRDRDEALAVGAVAYLTKPFAWVSLLEAVRRCCAAAEQ